MKSAKTLLLLPLCVGAVEYHGYAKLYPFGQFQKDSSSLTIQGRVRQDLSGWKENFHWQIAYEVSPVGYLPKIDLPARESLASAHTIYRVADFAKTIYPSEHENAKRSAVTHNLDGFSLDYKGDAVSFTVGRQTLGWGSARTINPTDVLTPLGFGEIYKEERVGIDAAVLRIPLGMTGEIETGAVAGESFEKGNNAGFFRIKGTAGVGDLSGALVYFRGNLLLGGDWESSIRKAGVRIELAQVITNIAERDTVEDYFRLTGGFDRMFSEKFILFGEYHFNESGENNGNIPTNITAYCEGNVKFPGRHYLAIGASHQIHPLVSLSESVMSDCSDGLTMISVASTLNLPNDERFSLDLGTIAIVGSLNSTATLYGGARFYW